MFSFQQLKDTRVEGGSSCICEWEERKKGTPCKEEQEPEAMFFSIEFREQEWVRWNEGNHAKKSSSPIYLLSSFSLNKRRWATYRWRVDSVVFVGASRGDQLSQTVILDVEGYIEYGMIKKFGSLRGWRWWNSEYWFWEKWERRGLHFQFSFSFYYFLRKEYDKELYLHFWFFL